MDGRFLGPVPSGSTRYTERRLDEKLWLNVIRYEWTTLLGGRQSGKSSALRHLQARINAEGGVCAYVDLSTIPQAADDQDFISTLCDAIVRSLGYTQRKVAGKVDVPQSILELPGYFDYFTRAFNDKRPVVIMIDEASAVLDELRTPFFSSLRALQGLQADSNASDNIKDLVFVFAGTFDPSELIDTLNSPFNVSEPISTSQEDFNREEISRHVKSLGIEIDEEQLFSYTNGHPYLTFRMTVETQNGTSLEDISTNLIVDDIHFVDLGQQLGSLSDRTINLLARVRNGEEFLLIKGASPGLDRLQTIGFISRDEKGIAKVRNKLYESFADGFIATRISTADGS